MSNYEQKNGQGKNGKKFFSFSQSEFKEKSSKDIPF